MINYYDDDKAERRDIFQQQIPDYIIYSFIFTQIIQIFSPNSSLTFF